MPVTHVTREVRYSPAQMFDLVATVERYPEFVPHWHTVRVSRRQENHYHTEQIVRLGPFRHGFSTDTFLFPHEKIEVISSSSPFKSFRLSWKFGVARNGGCRISLDADFELRSRALQAIGVILSGESISRMIAAFEARAEVLYGKPQISPAD